MLPIFRYGSDNRTEPVHKIYMVIFPIDMLQALVNPH
jgi:hypothetical protein